MSWNSGDNSYGFLTIPLFLYLCWEKKNWFYYGRFSWSLSGLAVTFFATVLLFIGEAGSMETLLFFGVWAGIVGLVVTFYGKRAWDLLFPLLILLFMVPLPPYINRTLTLELKLLASSMAASLLRLSGVSVVADGNILDFGMAQLQVVDACSGLRYVMPIVLVALLLGHFFCVSRWRRGLLCLLALGVTVLVNAGRIWLTGLFTVHGWVRLTEGELHDFIGLALFLVSVALLAWLAKYLRGQTPRIVAVVPDEPLPKMAGWRPVLLSAVLCCLFLGTGWALPRLQTAHTTPPRSSFDSFPMQIGGWQGARHYFSQEILDSLWADDYVSASFSRHDSSGMIYLLIPYYNYQGTRHTAHAPQSCLLGSGWSLVRTQETTVSPPGGLAFPVATMELRKGAETMLSAYFFLGRGRVVINPWWNKFYLTVDALTKQRTDGALVRVEMHVPSHRSLDVASKELAEFVASLWQVLPAYVPGEVGGQVARQ